MTTTQAALSLLFKPELLGSHALMDNIYYYSKNTNSEYIDCNDHVARDLNLISANDIKGRKDDEFGWSSSRIQFLRTHDLEVMSSQSISCKVENPFELANGVKRQLISYKLPVYAKDKLVGVAGISMDIYQSNFLQEENLNVLNRVLIHQASAASTKQLSTREIECLELFLHGKTAKETAALLGLSYRTIEEYFINIKNKIGCQRKRDLLSIFKKNRVK